MSTDPAPGPASGAAPDRPTRRRQAMTPGARYGMRFGWGMGLYAVTLVLALILRNHGVEGWLPMLLTLPSVGIITWALVAYYRESDEFAQRKLGESFVFAFAIGVPILLVLGLLEAFGGPHLSGMIAFVVMMAAWMIGSIVSAIRYR
ncbi:hypothetical protein [Brachybacterium phenoliresistens]|uniref:hypothetical protein n=1 Tax=Brachybacterium phenoliresistens TaxID=396014 RepID=UPI0031DE20C4